MILGPNQATTALPQYKGAVYSQTVYPTVWIKVTVLWSGILLLEATVYTIVPHTGAEHKLTDYASHFYALLT